jgi:hypothetical protein
MSKYSTTHRVRLFGTRWPMRRSMPATVATNAGAAPRTRIRDLCGHSTVRFWKVITTNTEAHPCDMDLRGYIYSPTSSGASPKATISIITCNLQNLALATLDSLEVKRVYSIFAVKISTHVSLVQSKPTLIRQGFGTGLINLRTKGVFWQA